MKSGRADHRVGVLAHVKLIGAVVLTFILAVALHAEATSAWVLWTHHSRHGDPKDRGGHWTIVRAMPRYEDCELQLRAEVHRAGEQQRHSVISPEERQASDDRAARRAAGGDSGGVVEVMQFYCLPDTVDPRGRRDRTDMNTSTWLQLVGLVFGFISALLIVLAQPATSEVNQIGGRRAITLRSPLLLYLGLFALALGFVLQGAGLIEAVR